MQPNLGRLVTQPLGSEAHAKYATWTMLRRRLLLWVMKGRDCGDVRINSLTELIGVQGMDSPVQHVPRAAATDGQLRRARAAHGGRQRLRRH